MKAYVYQWSLRPRPDICIELRIEARGAIAARREVAAFLRDHHAAGWEIESISRNPAEVTPEPRPVQVYPAER